MDPAWYYTQGAPAHPNQHQDYGGNNQQLVADNPNAVRDYIHALYQNPSHQIVPPTNNPAFFDKARQGILEAKHKTEQMLLVLRQQEEMAMILNTGIPDPGYTQNSAASGSAYPQVYPQASGNLATYQNAGWGNVVPDQWSYAQQGLAPQVQRIRSAHLSPEVEMTDAFSGQRYAQAAQIGATSQATASYQPQQHVQPQQQAQPQQYAQVQHIYVPPAEPQQAVPVSQQGYPAQAPQLYQPQPQYRPKRHPLQPDGQPSQAGPSQPRQSQKERDQITTTQKQLQYLHLLEKQHQRPQQEWRPPPAPQRQQPAPSHPVSAPVPPAHPPANSPPAQQVAPQVVQSEHPPNPAIMLPTLVASQSTLVPPKESSAPNNSNEAPAPSTQTHSPSPSKFPRSTPRLTLHDLRAVRRRSSQVPTAEPRPEAVIVDGGAQSSNQGAPSGDHVGTSTKTLQRTVNNKSGVAQAKRDAGSQNDDLHPTLSMAPPEPGNGVTSSNTSSNTPTVTAKPPPPASAGLAGPVPGTLPAPALAAIPPQISSVPAPKPVVAPSTSNASGPALNSGLSSRVPAASTSSAIPQRSMAARASDGNAAADAAGPAPLKLMLERLHQHGIDCVDIVRRAAEAVGAPTDLLRQPSTGMGGTSDSTPLFAPGQPLEIWTQNLKVSRAQGEAIVKHIWMISRDIMRKIGLDPVTGQPIGQTGGMSQQGSGRSADSTNSTGSTGPTAGGPVRNSMPSVGLGAPTIQSNVNLVPQATHLAQSRPPASQGTAHFQAQAPTSVIPSVSASGMSTVYDHPAIPFIQRATAAGPPPPQPTFNVPAVQCAPVIHPHGPQAQLQAYNAAIAQHHRLGLQPAQQPGGQPAQYSYQSHPIYQRPEMQASLQPQAPPMQQSQPAPDAQKAVSPVPKPPKGGGTPALDFLRSLGIVPTDGPLSGASSDAGSDTSKGRRKGKGKARAMDKVDGTSTAAVEISPATQPPAIQLSATQQEAPMDKGEVSLAQTSQPVPESAAPTVAIESHTVNAETLEPPPQLGRPATPPSPLLAPTIAVLQEPRSPSTTESPLPEPVVDPGSVLEHEDTPQPVMEAPESVQAAQLVAAPAPAPSSAPVLATSPTPGPAPAPIQTPTPAPSPGPAQPPLSPVSSVAPPALVPDVQMADPLVSDLPRAPSSPPPSTGAMLISSPPHPPPSVPRPGSSASQRPPAPTEYAPLKRKRDSGPSSGPVPEPSGGAKESWAVVYARAANQLSEANKAKKARSEQSMVARSGPRASTSGAGRALGSSSTTAHAQDKGKGKALFRPETPPSRVPLFRPETPPSNGQGEDTDVDIDVVGDEEPIAAPRFVPPQRQPPSSNGKRRMIMEVVLPLRKGAKPQPRAKAAAVPVQSMIDLTMDESESEDEDQEEVDEDEDEKEPDLKMLRRRLREHKCKWQGCVGPAALSSAELLGVHLHKKHPPRRDASGYFACRWNDCRMQFKRGKDLWEHMSDEHIIRPLWCPYQNCARAAVDMYQLDTHVRRKHRGRPDHELRPLARPEECANEEQVLRPSAFPPGVPYFMIMGMALGYNVVPAKVSAQWHAKNGPKILRSISSTMSPVRAPAPYVSLEARPNMGASSPGGSLPAFGSPIPARRRVRLGTVPPDVLGEELEVVEMLAPRSSSAHSPARSHISINSDDETPEREMRPLRGRGRPRLAARGRGSRGRGRARGQGGSIAGGNLGERNLAPHASTSAAVPASRDPSTPTDASAPTLASTSSVPMRAAPTPAVPKPRLKMVVELPSSQGRKQRM